MAAPSLKFVTLETKDRVTTLTVNRPDKLNALNAEVMDDLRSAALFVRSDPGTGVVIVTGAGEKAFVAGADIQQFTALDAAAGSRFAHAGQHVFHLIETCPKPVIAAVNGYALGGGCELALACHIRFASDRAKLGQPEVKLGIIPGYGGSQRLPRLVGRGRALELILGGHQIDAAEAMRIGLVNRVFAPEQLLPETEKFARGLLANGPLAMGFAIQAVHASEESGQTEGAAHEAALFGMCFATEDQKEGANAFLAKRPAEFKGR